MNKRISRLWSKNETRKAVAALRASQLFTIDVTETGFIVTHSQAGEVFSAMIGTRGYLVRYYEQLFV
jgi:hypothetical protein